MLDYNAPRPSHPGIRVKRILLKLSGEVLCGTGTDGPRFGIDPDTVKTICTELGEVHALGAQLGLVIGGGNIFRGLKGAASGMDRTAADQMGMLATVMNALALQDGLEKLGVPTRVQTAIAMAQVAEPYIRRRAMRHMEKGRVVIFAAGTGNPYFSTDTAAALRAMEVGAELLCKATKVDGVYDRDPLKSPDARMFVRLSYDKFLADRIGVMDSTAVTLCREHLLRIRVFNLYTRGNIQRVVNGEPIGTLIGPDD